MASLTPLSKVLIGLTVLGGMASAVWHLGLKNYLSISSQTPPAASASSTVRPPPAPVAPAVPARPTIAVPSPHIPASSPATLSATEHAETGRQLLANGNFAQARVHLEQAVKGGDGSAACLLGEMTLKGQGGIAANPDTAASLFQLAQSRNMLCFSAAR